MSAKLDYIRAFTRAGFALVPLCSLTEPHQHKGEPCPTPGKVPVRGGWEDTKPGQYPDALLAENNYGVILGNDHVVVDVDPRNFKPGDNPLRRLIARIGPLTSFVVRSGGGGLHIYLKKPADLFVKNSIHEFPGVEFKSGSGRQVVGPGCLHISGKQYEVVPGSQPIEKIADAPAQLLALIQRTEAPFSEVGTGEYKDDAVTQGWYAAYLQDQAPKSGSFAVACRGRDLGLSPATTWNLMVEVWNPRRAVARTPEELKAKVIHAYKYARGAVGNAHPAADFANAPIPLVDPLEPPAPKTASQEADPSAFVYTKNGALVRNFQNLVVFLKYPTAGLAGVFGYNEFTGRVEFTRPAPWHRGKMPAALGVGDNDLKLLKAHLAMRHAFEMTVGVIEEAVTVVAYDNRFHPVRDYLKGLTWDGTPRLDTWLQDYLGVEDSEYTRAVSRKVLCAAVARVLRPGCKFDHVLVLEGAQDIGKSSVCRILGGEWAADFPIDPHNKDTIQLVQGKWVVELAELEVSRRTEEDALKAFITRTKDEARLAYGRTVGEFPRQFIFIASKNPGADGTYLKDDTGNRRWWPVLCRPKRGQVDFSAFKAVRDQLWAEAYHVMRSKGEHLYMETTGLKVAAREVAAKRHADHAWQERIEGWLHERDKNAETRRDFLTARDVYIDAMGGIDKQLDRRAQLAIAQCLRALGWEAAFRRIDGRMVRGYERSGRVVAPVGGIDVEKKLLDSLGDLA